MRSTKLTKLSAILLGASLTAGVLGIACACGDTHDHTFADGWTKTETEHYYAATCEHENEKKDVGGHDTKGTNGACSVCGYIKTPVSSFAYEEVTGGIEIIAYTGDPMDEITVPANYDGKKVVSIADGTFSILNEETDAKLDSLKQIKKITVENGITEIGKENFVRMASLTEVSTPESVTAFGGSCFYHCPALTKVVIAKGAVTISENSFVNCNKLANITLPADLAVSKAVAFKNLASSLTITYGGSDMMFRIFTNLYNWESGATATVVPYGGQQVTTAKAGGFEYMLNADGNSYTIISLTKDIISADSTEIYLPTSYNEKNVTAIDSGVFNINAYTDEELIAYLDTVTAIDVNSAFKAIDTNITSIGNYNFVGLKALTRLTLPAEIENETLIGCFCSVPLRGQIRIPRGVKVLQECMNFPGDSFFCGAPGTSAVPFSLVLPASFEKFEHSWQFNNKADGQCAFTILMDTEEADAVEAFNAWNEASTYYNGAMKDFLATFVAAQFVHGKDNPFAAAGWQELGFLYNSYDEVVNDGY